ncbi:hypothetical protein PGT21_036669 [Puccinia graminis f. sp. tritici]|uniref:Uncharacterized protein n=1 Tax=Puccinia graminis f. sp. tritici TaxID=56615 RepID=A0A5B0Q0B3_PUCGR|nr:hypothetical protein PGT21_036669 [Puccinia graminis f. sp. tritici]KAA1126177.1 hypothetical protein PGTUg99_007219 [Puccinia graminis f. sp. tritici]
MAALVRLLAIILLFQSGWALTVVTGEGYATSAFVESYFKHTSRIFHNFAQSSRAKILPNVLGEGFTGSTRTMCTRWQSGAWSLISKTIATFQDHFNRRGKQINKDPHLHLGFRATSHWPISKDNTSTELMMKSYHTQDSELLAQIVEPSPARAVINYPAETFVVIPPNTLFSQVSSVNSLLASQSTSKTSTPFVPLVPHIMKSLSFSSTHHATKKISRDIANASINLNASSSRSDKRLVYRRPAGSPMAMSAIPLQRGRMAAWKF